WLFAVALGLHRQSSAVVIRAVPVIALGHALSIALVAGAVVATGFLVDGHAVRMAVGTTLIAWALWHQLFGHRRRVRIRMQAGLAGLALWAFLMATAHGAGLMILPALMPLCMPDSPVREVGGGESAAMTAAAVGVHTVAMLIVVGVISLAVYR